MVNFAFLLMGPYDPNKHRVRFESEGGTALMVGVSSLEEAADVARELGEAGIDLIEMCGAFGEGGAAKVGAAAGERVAVGYVVHDPSEDEKFARLFGE